MKRIFTFCIGIVLLIGCKLYAQTSLPEWQVGVDKLKELVQTNSGQDSEIAAELLKGKNKKNMDLIISMSRVYLEANRLQDAERYLEMAKKVNNKDAKVSVMEGDIALVRNDVGKACQLYEQGIYFDSGCKEAYLKYARAYKSVSPSEAINKLKQLKSIMPDCLEADKELAEVYYANNRFKEAVEAYANFIDTPVATEKDVLKYAFALFLNHDFEKSLEVVQKGLQMNGRHAAFNRLAMYNYIDMRKYAEAEKAADAFFNASDNADYSYLDYRYHGALLSALKKYDQAIMEYQKALEKDSSQVDVWRDISDAYEQNGVYSKAIDSYHKYYSALTDDQKTPEALFQLGRLYYGKVTSIDTLTVQPADRKVALQAADSLFSLVSELAPGSYLGELWRARTNSAMDPETIEGLAKPFYEKVVEHLLAKSDPRYNSTLVECYSYLGYYYLLKSDYQVSKEYWNKILAIDPTNATAQKALAGIK